MTYLLGGRFLNGLDLFKQFTTRAFDSRLLAFDRVHLSAQLGTSVRSRSIFCGKCDLLLDGILIAWADQKLRKKVTMQWSTNNLWLKGVDLSFKVILFLVVRGLVGFPISDV